MIDPIQPDETSTTDTQVSFSDDRLNDLLDQSSFLFKLLLAATFLVLIVALIHMGWAMALRTTRYIFP